MGLYKKYPGLQSNSLNLDMPLMMTTSDLSSVRPMVREKTRTRKDRSLLFFIIIINKSCLRSCIEISSHGSLFLLHSQWFLLHRFFCV